MIKQIFIKDYILIDELLVKFDEGLNVITGETGAGKSIVINAIDLVFAPRISKEIIKTGKEKATIELVLDSSKKDLYNIFEEFGIDYDANEIIISKEITQNAVRTRVNGSLVNYDFIKTLKDIFLDIHSQHQTYAFMQPKYHIHLLDSYAKDSYAYALTNFKELFLQYQNYSKELEEARTKANSTESQIDFLKFQINEIEEAQLFDENEDENLKNELNVLTNIEKLKELTGSSFWILKEDDNSILNALNTIKTNISKAAGMDETLLRSEELLINAIETLNDAAYEIRNYSQNLDNDTNKIDSLQERLFLLDKLKRKYGGNLYEVMNTLANIQTELEQIEYCTQNIEELEQKIQNIYIQLETEANTISAHRKQYAQILSSKIEEKLEKLELPKARFKIEITPCDLNQYGQDKVEFLISTNISEELKPLAKVASGGEISRVMLAIKTIFAQSDDIDTVIFDEIDTGISGKTSQSVAEEIAELANFHQVILITHQAIIASKARKHFYVTKSQDDNQTNVGFYVLSDENRVKALAELAGGEINEQSIEFARSLLAQPIT